MLYFCIFLTLLVCVSGVAVPRLQRLPDGRIVGGQETTVEKFPHQISMRFWESHRCGGSIYKPNLIITAAHCVYELAPKNLVIIAGSTYISKGGTDKQVKDIIIHERYDPWDFDYDIAILTLESPYDYTLSIQPIDLASVNEEIRGGTKVLVSGWGQTSEENWFAPDTLQFVEVFIVSNEQCNKDYEGTDEITERMLCAGHPAGGRDACSGDSGGPLALNGKLYGIVSWGMGCARPNYPGVYVKVSAFRDWIADQVKA